MGSRPPSHKALQQRFLSKIVQCSADVLIDAPQRIPMFRGSGCRFIDAFFRRPLYNKVGKRGFGGLAIPLGRSSFTKRFGIASSR